MSDSGESTSPHRAGSVVTASGEIIAERRYAPRVPVALHVVEIDGTTTYFQYATNLSVGGLYVHGTLGALPGARVKLVFVPPGSEEEITVPAEVVGYTQGDGRGAHLRFIDDEDSDLRHRIRAFIDKRTANIA